MENIYLFTQKTKAIKGVNTMSKIKKISAILLVLCVIAATFTACSPQKKLIGSWRDSSGLVGYDFQDDNRCKVVYADTEILGKKITANIEGSYTVEKADDGKYYITIKYTFLAVSFSETYLIDLEGDTLTLTNTDGSTPKTLLRTDPAKLSTVAQSTTGGLSSAAA